jgi:hypothetical protein
MFYIFGLTKIHRHIPISEKKNRITTTGILRKDLHLFLCADHDLASTWANPQPDKRQTPCPRKHLVNPRDGVVTRPAYTRIIDLDNFDAIYKGRKLRFDGKNSLP